MGKFFPKATCVYLDQFAVSAICDDHAEASEQWTAIGNLLKEGVEKKKIVCPYSLEHLIETSMKHERSAFSQDLNFAVIARNVKIRNEVDSSARHIIATIRGERPNYHTYFQHFEGTVMDDNWKKTKIQENRNTLEDMTTDMFKTANLIRGANKMRPPAEMREVVFSSIRHQYEADLLERFFHLSTFGRFDSRTVTLAGITIPHWADVLFHKLVTEHRMTREEALRGKTITMQRGLAAFPSIFIRANLEASMACNSKKETVNDQIDTIRIAGALPAVDILLTDGGKSNDIRDTKLDKLFNTEVYSGKRTDLGNFTNRLKSIL